MGEDGKPAPVLVGPGVVCFAPAVSGISTFPRWEFIEPEARSFKALQDQVDDITSKTRSDAWRAPARAQVNRLFAKEKPPVGAWC
jgi:hypothetical protein